MLRPSEKPESFPSRTLDLPGESPVSPPARLRANDCQTALEFERANLRKPCPPKSRRSAYEADEKSFGAKQRRAYPAKDR